MPKWLPPLREGLAPWFLVRPRHQILSLSLLACDDVYMFRGSRVIQVRDINARLGDELAGGDLGSLEEVTISLTVSERQGARDDLAAAARGVSSRPLDDEDLLTTAELSGNAFPSRLLRQLRQFRRNGNDTGAILIRHMPVDVTIPPTPESGCLPHWSKLPVATFAQLAVTSAVGDVISYADEKAGRIIQDVVPVKGAEDRQENSGTMYLELHTEDGFHPHKPDFITLMCLRSDNGSRAHTVLGATSLALPLISERAGQLLREPLFRIRVSSSFGEGCQNQLTEPLPVLSGAATDPELLADFHAMEPCGEDARAALEELRSAFLATLRGAVLDIGDLLVIDNRHAVHGRSPFAAHFDGTDRWLRRCFAVSDIRRSRVARYPGSRVCAPLMDIGLAASPGAPGAASGNGGPACNGS